jgi:hypothetical protein
MKKIFLFIIVLFSFSSVKAQTIYNNTGNQVCYVQDNSFYSGGKKTGFIQQGYGNIEVYSSSGKVGVIQGNSLYNNSGNVVCYIQGNSFYSGANKVGFVSQGVIYDGSGNRVGSAQGLGIIEIAVYYFYFN